MLGKVKQWVRSLPTRLNSLQLPVAWLCSIHGVQFSFQILLLMLGTDVGEGMANTEASGDLKYQCYF